MISTELIELMSEYAAKVEVLQEELEKYDWKQGHPEHENEVLICTDNYGKKFYTTNSWKKGEYWNNLFQGKYIAYAEIRPFGKVQE